MDERRYAVITPAHNEEQFLPKTIACLVGQRVRPARWIIVDDRSTDSTYAIARRASEDHAFIEAVRLRGGDERTLGANVVRVFDEGLKHLETEVDYLVKLDADVILDEDYFSGLMERFESEPGLGIASGKLFVEYNGKWMLERFPDFHVPGLCKMYRNACFEDIGGLIPIYGWDILDGAKARSKGWITRSFEDMTIRHLRLTGSAKGVVRGHMGHGRGMWAVRAHPLFVLARAIYRAFEPPYLSGLFIIAGYLQACMRHEHRLEDLELARYLRREQLRRLMGRMLKQEELLPRRLKAGRTR